jgi:hypothetical protein
LTLPPSQGTILLDEEAMKTSRAILNPSGTSHRALPRPRIASLGFPAGFRGALGDEDLDAEQLERDFALTPGQRLQATIEMSDFIQEFSCAAKRSVHLHK